MPEVGGVRRRVVEMVRCGSGARARAAPGLEWLGGLSVDGSWGGVGGAR